MQRVYLVTRVRNALATDHRTGLTHLQIQFTDSGRGVVTGEVASPEQHAAVTEVLRSVEGAEDFLNRTHVKPMGAPHDPETILGHRR
jgi:osmotically-inducible protein OsmY